ncbi:MAG: chemotaxis protein CheB [Promethearchaeota archaeon]
MSRIVLIASVSAFRRTLLTEILSPYKDIIIVGTARNGQETIDIIEEKNPDILIVDIEYENKEWFYPFNQITKNYDIPTIILTDCDPNKLESLEIPVILKSHEYIVKPPGIWRETLPKIKDEIVSKIFKLDFSKRKKIDSKSRLIHKQIITQQKQEKKVEPQFNIKSITTFEYRSEDYFLDLTPVKLTKIPTKVVVIGASVGGPRTLSAILSEIPQNYPAPILVVQHLNHLFMRQFATSLKSICKARVKIGMNYEEIEPGIIYISPGDKHMQVTVKNDKPYIRTFEGEPVNFCRPSVDVLFYSTARVYRENTLGILLTGMGRDGVEGLRAIKALGGTTIAESEETSILYGMPKVAAETGAAELIIPNHQIIDEMIRFTS